MARKVADCREFPSESGCSLTIAGEEEEVVRAAAMHAVDAHGHEDTAELREQVRGMLKDEAPIPA
jgi:predicted small metal-binding protein